MNSNISKCELCKFYLSKTVESVLLLESEYLSIVLLEYISAVCHLVNVLAMRPIAAGSRRARPADEARILHALTAGDSPVAGIG